VRRYNFISKFLVSLYKFFADQEFCRIANLYDAKPKAVLPNIFAAKRFRLIYFENPRKI